MAVVIGDRPGEIKPESARLALVGYAFGTREIRPSPQKAYRAAFEPETAPIWAYRTYDCLPPPEGEEFSDLDVLVAAGLNGRVGADSVAALKLAVRRAAKPLNLAVCAARDRGDLTFADLDREELGNNPPEGSIGRYLSQAWLQMSATPGVGVALTHKVLHHKQPGIFPLLDNLTMKKLTSKKSKLNAWQQIHADIAASRAEFDKLSSEFAQIAEARDGAALSLTRLYDILLWLKAKGGNEWEAAVAAGRGL